MLKITLWVTQSSRSARARVRPRLRLLAMLAHAGIDKNEITLLALNTDKRLFIAAKNPLVKKLALRTGFRAVGLHCCHARF